MAPGFVMFLAVCSLFYTSVGLKVRFPISIQKETIPDRFQLVKSKFNTNMSHTLSMAYHNVTEWDKVFRHRKFENVTPASSVVPICMEGRGLPQFYLLGAHRAGTTTMARDLMDLGIKSAKRKIKELHHFDGHCGFKSESLRGEEEHIPVCHKISGVEKWNWARWFSETCDAQPPLADMTPLNLRLPGLPGVLTDLYGLHSTRISFGILVRDPLERFQSGWYHGQTFMLGKSPKNGSFQRHVNEMIPQAMEMQKYGWLGTWLHINKELRRSYAIDQLYRSLYSLNVQPWLEKFKASRFIIIPSRSYQSNPAFKKRALRDVGDLLGTELDVNGIEHFHESTQNRVRHPSVQDDLDKETQETLRREFFDPTVADFAGMLAMKIPHGLKLAGFDKGKVSQKHVKEFLEAHW